MPLSPNLVNQRTDELNIYPQLRRLERTEDDDPNLPDYILTLLREPGYWYHPYIPRRFIEENGIRMAIIDRLSDAFFTRDSKRTILTVTPDTFGGTLEEPGLPLDIDVESNDRVITFYPFREVRVTWPKTRPDRPKLTKKDQESWLFIFCLFFDEKQDLDFLVGEYQWYNQPEPEVFMVTKVNGPRLRELVLW